MQIPGIYYNYNKTFYPVTHFELLRLLLVLATLEDWEIHQLDVKLVFLNGVLDEKIRQSHRLGKPAWVAGRVYMGMGQGRLSAT